MNKDEVLKIVEKDGFAILNFSAFRRDRDVVMSSVRQNGIVMAFCDDKFLDDIEIAIEAVKSNGNAIQCFGAFRKNKEVVLSAVRQNGRAIMFCDTFQDDIDVVLEAVKQDKTSITYCQKMMHNMAFQFILQDPHHRRFIQDIELKDIWFGF